MNNAGVLGHTSLLAKGSDPILAKYPQFFSNNTYPVTPLAGFNDMAGYFNLDNGSGKIRGIYAEGNFAAVPVLLLFYLLAVKKILAHHAAIWGFAASVLLAGFVFGMPWHMVTGAVSAGVVFGIIRIAWTLLAAVFVYELTVESGEYLAPAA